MSNKNEVNKQVSNRIDATNKEIETDAQIQPAQNLDIQESNVSSQSIETEPVKSSSMENISMEEDSLDNDINISDEDLSRYSKIMLGIEEPKEPEGSNLLREVLDTQMRGEEIPMYDKYEGSSWDDFTGSMYNAGVIRTLEGVANIIPTVASAVSGAEWAETWERSVAKWADNNEEYISEVGKKSFFDTYDLRSFSAGMGQGLGSMIPLFAATAATGGIGGAAGLASVGFRAGAKAAIASYGNIAGMSAMTLNILPTLVESGIESGLSHQASSAFGLTVAPIIGAMEKIGFDKAVQAGLGTGAGVLSKSAIDIGFKNSLKTGSTPSVKKFVGSIAQNYIGELRDKGAKVGAKELLKAGALEAKDLVSSRALAVYAKRGLQGALPEAATESLQSLVETSAKQIYDLQFADKDAKVGEGKFGVSLMDKETWTQALEEGFYGGLIGGSFSTIAGASQSQRRETVGAALMSAKKNGNLDESVEKMYNVIDGLSNQESDKNELRNLVSSSADVVRLMPNEIKDANAQNQIFELSYLASAIESDFEINKLEGAIPIGLEKIAKLKEKEQNQVIGSITDAINDIYATTLNPKTPEGSTIDLFGKKEDGSSLYYFSSTDEEIKTKKETKGIVDQVKDQVSQGVKGIKGLFKGKKNVEQETEQGDIEQVATEEDTEKEVAESTEVREVAPEARDVVEPEVTEEVTQEVKPKKEITPEVKEVKPQKSTQPTISEEEQTDKGEVTATPSEPATSLAKPKVEVKPENITSKGSAFAKKLTNVGNRLGITYKGKKFENTEHAYQTYKSGSFNQKGFTLKGGKVRGGKLGDTFAIMTDILTEKLKQYPDLVTGIDERGGLEYIEKSTHDVIGDKFWETKSGQNKFIESLAKAYKNVKGETATAKPKVEVDTEQQQIQRLNNANVREGGFADKRQVINAIRKYIDNNYEGQITPEMTDALIDFYKKTPKDKRDAIPSAKIQKEQKQTVEETVEQEPITEEDAQQQVEGEKEVTTEEAKDAEIDNPIDERFQNENFNSLDEVDDLKIPKETRDKLNNTGDNIIRDLFGDEDVEKKSVIGMSTSSVLIKDNPRFELYVELMQKLYPKVDIKVLERVYSNKGLEVLGRVVGNKIQLNEDKATQDTLFHELAHIYSPLLSGTKLWNRGLTLIKDTKYFKNAQELYPEETKENQLEEALVNLIGEESLDLVELRVDSKLMPRIKAWLKQFWNRIKYTFNKASAKDIANIMAYDLVMRQSPFEQEGLMFGEKLSKAKKEKRFEKEYNLTRPLRNAAIRLRLVLNDNKQLAPIATDLYKKLAFREYVRAGIGSEMSWADYKKKHKAIANKMYIKILGDFNINEGNLESFLEGNVIESGDSFLVDKTELDSNVRGIIENLYDMDGNSMPEQNVYGVAVQVGRKGKPDFFIRDLKEFKGNSLDARIANELGDILESLPKNISRPIINNFSSLGHEPVFSVVKNNNGFLNVGLTNTKLGAKKLKELIVSRIVTKAYVSAKNPTVLEERKKAEKQIESYLSSEGSNSLVKFMEDVNNEKKSYQTYQRKLTGLVNALNEYTGIKASKYWFAPVKDTSKIKDAKELSIVEQEQVILKSMRSYFNAVQKYYNRFEANSSALKNEDISDNIKTAAISKIIDDSSPLLGALFFRANQIAMNIANSSGEKTSFNNVMGNKEMSTKVVGFLHRVFNKEIYLKRDLKKHKGLNFLDKNFLNDLQTLYYENYNNKIDNVARPSGVKNVKNNEAAQFDGMYKEDINDMILAMMFNNIQKKNDNIVYWNSIGTISSRKHQQYVKSIFLPLEKVKSLIEKIKEQGFNKSIIPDVNKIEKTTENIKDFLSRQRNASKSDYITSMQNWAKYDLATYLQNETKLTYEQASIESKVIDYKQGEKTRYLNKGQELYLEYLDGYIKENNIAERMAYNEAFNRFVGKSIVAGNLKQYPSAEEVQKRLQGITSPSVTQDMYDYKDDKPIKGSNKIKVFVYKDDGYFDSQAFFNPVITKKLERNGGKVINYGNTHKPLIYETLENGDTVYIKSAAISFKEGDNWNTPYTQKYKKVQDWISKQDGNVVLVSEEALKGKQYDAIDLDEILEGKASPVLDEELHSFGTQFNMYKDATKDGVNVAISRQLITTAPTQLDRELDKTVLNKELKEGNITQEEYDRLIYLKEKATERNNKLISELDKHMAQLTTNGLRKAEQKVRNKPKTLKQFLNAAGKGVTDFARSLFERHLSTTKNIDKLRIDQYDMSSASQSYLSSIFTKEAILHRGNGSELLQLPDFDGKLKFQEFNVDKYGVPLNGEKFTYSEVLVPKGYAELGESLIQVRIPLSDHINIMVSKVVGFTPAKSNMTVVPQGWVDKSNSDFDGDKLFTLKRYNPNDLQKIREDYNKAKEEKIELLGDLFEEKDFKQRWADENGVDLDRDGKLYNKTEDKLFDTLHDLLTSPELFIKDKGYNLNLDIEKYKNAAAKAKQNNNPEIYKTLDSAKQALKKDKLSLSSLEDEIESSLKLKESRQIIGIFANGAKWINTAALYKFKHISKFNLFNKKAAANLSVKLPAINFTAKYISENASTLQMALDDAKHLFLYKGGLTRNNSDMAIYLLSEGYQLDEILTFFTSAPIQMYTKLIDSKSILNPDLKMTEEEAIAEVKLKYPASKLFYNDLPAQELLKKYKELKIESTIIGKFREVLALDGRLPKNAIELMNLQATIKELKNPKDGNLTKFTISQYFLNNKTFLAREKVLDKLAVTYKDYYSIASTSNDEDQRINELNKSLDRKNNNVDNNKITRTGQKVYSKMIAKKIAKTNISTKEDLDTLVNDAINVVFNATRTEKLVKQEYEWIDLISYDVDTGLLTPAYKNGLPELNKNEEENNVSQEYIERTWNKLPSNVKDIIFEYAIHVEGLINEGNNITHLIPAKLFDPMFREFSNNIDKINITEEYQINMALELFDEISLLKGEDAPNVAKTKITSKNIINKFFATIEDGNRVIYKATNIKVESDGTNNVYSADIENISELSQTVYGNKRVVFYNATDKNTYTTPIENVEKTPEQNVEDEISKNISDNLGTQTELFQAVDKTTKGQAIQVNRRLLRRLTNKFKVPHKVINNPDIKVKGFYDRENNVAVINEAYATGDTAIHEFAHPFVIALKLRNTGLYVNLANEIKKSSILSDVKKLQPELTEEQAIEEAIVTAIGKEGQAKIKDQTLLGYIKQAADFIVRTIRELFGAKVDTIEDLSVDTTLGQLADIMLEKKSFTFDVENNTTFIKRFNKLVGSKSELQEMFNKNIEIVKKKDVLSNEHLKAVKDLESTGLMLNDTFIVKEINQPLNGGESVLSFRASFDNSKTWLTEIKAKYPKAKVIDKFDSEVNGFEVNEVSIGEIDNVYVYVPLDSRSAEMRYITQQNLQFQANPDISTSKNVKYFNDYAFTSEEDILEDTPAIDIVQVRQEVSTTIKKLLKQERESGRLKTEKEEYQFVRILLTRKILEQITIYNKINKADKLSGDITIVNTETIQAEIIKDEFEEYWYQYMTNSVIPNVEGFTEAVRKFEKLLIGNKYRKATDGKIIGGSKMIASDIITKEVNDQATRNKEIRQKFFNKIPVVGSVYKYFSKNLVKGRGWLLYSFTPEVAANVVVGHKKTFLHQLLSTEMIKADEQRVVIGENAEKAITSIVKEAEVEELKTISTIYKTPTSKLKKYKLPTTQGSKFIPIGNVMSLYKSLLQNDVRQKLVNKKTGLVNVTYWNVDTKNEIETNVVADKFMDEFEKHLEKHPEQQALLNALDAGFNSLYDRLTKAVKLIVGFNIDNVENYFPTRFGNHSEYTLNVKKARLEDIPALNERFQKDMTNSIKLDDAFETYSQYQQQAVNFSAYALPLTNLKRFLSSYKKQVDADDGLIKYMTDMIDSIQDYRLIQGIGDADFDKQYQKYMNNFTLSVLGWNPSVSLKQTVSVASAASEVGSGIFFDTKAQGVAASILKSSYGKTNLKKGQIGQLLTGDNAHPVIKEIMNLCPLMRERFKGHIDRDQGTLTESALSPFSPSVRKRNIFGAKVNLDKTMDMIRINDAATIAYIYEHIKNQMTKEGKSDFTGANKLELKNRFETVVHRSQPTYNNSSRTNFSRMKNPIIRLLTMFSSQRAKNMNMMVDSLIAAIENPNSINKAKFMRTTITVGILASLGIAVIDKVKYVLYSDDDDEKLTDVVDLSKRTLLNTMSNFYGIGQFASAIDANYNNKPFGKTVQIPVLDNFMGLSAGFASLLKGDFRKAADKTIKSGFAIGGIPLSPYTNFNIDDFVKGEDLSDFQEKLKDAKGQKYLDNYLKMLEFDKVQNRIKKESKTKGQEAKEEKDKLKKIDKRLRKFAFNRMNPSLNVNKVNR